LRILQVANGFPPQDKGGVETYTRALSQALVARGHQVHIFCREEDHTRVDFSWHDDLVDGLPVRRVVNNFVRVNGFADYYYSRDVEEIFVQTIGDWHPDIVHFQHAIGLSASLPARATAEGWPCTWTLWDYWPICPVNTLLLKDGTLCRGSQHAVNCFYCVSNSAVPLPGQQIPALRPGEVGAELVPPTYQHTSSLLAGATRILRRVIPRPVRLRLLDIYNLVERHRPRPRRLPSRAVASAPGGPPLSPSDRAAITFRADYMRASLQGCNFVVAPLPFVREIYAEFGLPADRIKVIEPGMDLSQWQRTCRPSHVRSSSLRLGYIGSLMRHKGVDVIVRAVHQLEEPNIELRLHGFFVKGDPYAATLQRLAKGDSRIHFMGPYHQHELASLLADVDVLLMPALWHETYSFVTREAVLAGVPVIAADMGGMRAAIDDGENGLLLPARDVEAWAMAIRRLAAQPDLLDRMADAQRQRPVRSIEANAADLEELYLEMLGSTGRVP
jgi:glycosyltransferase involved in cell wall biosynthesis